MNRVLKKYNKNYINIYFSKEEFRLLNRALCIYGHVIDSINMFCDYDDTLPSGTVDFEGGRKAV